MTPQEEAALWAAMPASLWLAGADRSPRRFETVIQWDRDPQHLAALPCGVRWHALQMPEQLGLTAFQALQSTAAGGSAGPVLHNQRDSTVSWLLPIEPETGSVWTSLHSALHLLGGGHLLDAVGPDCLSPAAGAVYWAHWPAVTGTLTPPDLLRATLRTLLEVRS